MWSPAAKPIMTFGAQYGGGDEKLGARSTWSFVVYR